MDIFHRAGGRPPTLSDWKGKKSHTHTGQNHSSRYERARVLAEKSGASSRPSEPGPAERLPHIHMIGTRELVNIRTGEIIRPAYLPYRKIRLHWMHCFCKLLVRRNIMTAEESRSIRARCTNGFHVYFQPITGSDNDVLFRTAEYIASGFFHNSQILKVDDSKKEIIFKYRSWVDHASKKKYYKNIKMDIFEFMARMLYFLPDHHQKSIRYYGIYAQSKRRIVDYPEPVTCTWSRAIEKSFENKFKPPAFQSLSCTPASIR